MTAPAIETRGLRKVYGRTVGLESLDLRVEAGEVFGFLGPNGAGKTTAVKLLLGLTRPTAGEGSVLGRPIGDRATRRRVGYLPELFRYQAWLTAREVLVAARAARRAAGFEPATRRDRPRPRRSPASPIGPGTGPAASRRGCSSASGWRPRSWAIPALVILDEPTSALDPVGRDDVRAIIREARDRGSAVFLNSHLLGEVERLCDRVAIVNHGRVIAAGTLAELLGESSVRIQVTEPAAWRRRSTAALGAVRQRRLRRRLADHPPDRPRPRPGRRRRLVGLGGRVHAVDPGRRSLEDLFLGMVREDGDDAGADGRGRPPHDRCDSSWSSPGSPCARSCAGA